MLPETDRLLAAGLILLGYLGMSTALLWPRRKLSATGTPSGAPLLIAYASQTGTAERLAYATAGLLRQAGRGAEVLDLGAVDAACLARHHRALFIVSTYGEGDAPDNGAAFMRKWMASPLPLTALRYAVLALGNRQYRHFCGFGRQLDAWLAQQGAQTLFARVEADNADQDALHAWQQALASHFGTGAAGNLDVPGDTPWITLRLHARDHLNPGSAGNPLYRIALVRDAADGTLPDWQAGDRLRLRLPGPDTRPREYSLASLPQDGHMELLVREHRQPDGSPGRLSGWLGAQAGPGATIDAQLYRHPAFGEGENTTRPALFIGNGSGLAGLLAHLKARIARGQQHNWLIYGERSAQHDTLLSEPLDRWQADGFLRLERVFSRDTPSRPHVQDRLHAVAEEVVDWVARGAAIYVCGSLRGMGAGVDAALAGILGQSRLDELAATGRYRRDVY